MYSFKNDYSEGAHPRILNALLESNFEQNEGYGEDHYSIKAIELLKEEIESKDIDIHFLVGGTQTNLTVISAFLRPHEAVISADTGHILVHETGAIEATGHKVISVEVEDGKLRVEHVKNVLEMHTDEHMVKPKLVYISNSTEIGSIYKKQELEELSGFCKENNLILYIDGARLGSALCSEENDLKMSDLARLADAFYIGGTKNGALLGEALVICKEALKEDFRFHIKQKGAMLAKGKLLGIQFLELFRDKLYFDLASHANKLATLLINEIETMGYKFLVHSPSNQVFPILPNKVIEKLQEKYSFYMWSKVDDENSSIRLVTSWATKEDAVKAFIEDLKSLTI
ncbi:threonine aldolase family protein [Clostridium cellulovorans]|uniref:Aromatic amino acid beta-eliminating lyase/threonine aldolase n=1 Tax=Clostridium cellulovorans (strain ATCC 35296 / DSM 3052 / OCM 3 / 743B) TaxID=573061 RepID=D9SNF6_CLOC7|nr:aminotransferase class I/II-fold pyridoxal phosphate-dependent enzyme [Clostridium cellulovorans]ADL53948.1 aromatic amino acid beta-eliminating lyase/threonine aldolase [Clostridium cellulovorans 743B]